MQKTKTLLPLLLFVSVLAFAMIPNTMATLPNGNGIQKINEHIHETQDTSLYFARGYYYSPVAPDEFSGQIKVGTWLTIGFGWAIFYVPEEDLEEMIAAEIELIKTWPLGLTFGGEEIDINDCWRFDDVVIRPMEEIEPEDPDAVGLFYFYIPFRYYIPPRKPGHYEIISTFAGSPWSIGYVEWVPANQL